MRILAPGGLAAECASKGCFNAVVVVIVHLHGGFESYYCQEGHTHSIHMCEDNKDMFFELIGIRE